MRHRSRVDYEDRVASAGHPAAPRAAMPGGMSHGSYVGFKAAVAVIIFHFGVKMLVQFADILLPFIMALLLMTVLDPVKQVTFEVLECTLVLLFQQISLCSCCLRPTRKAAAERPPLRLYALREWVEKFLLLISIAITVLLAGRLFWILGRILWLSGKSIIHDFHYYQLGVQKRGQQVQDILRKFHLQKRANLGVEDLAELALNMLRYAAEFFSRHLLYTLTQVSLTAIFVLFLLYSPVQRDFAPVMQGVFSSMETYLKLKTFISVLMGITNSIALAVIGLELPAAWGLMTFLANFIPNVGGPSVSILPCAIAFLDVRKSLYQVLAAFLAQFVLHFNIANFVEPIVFGTTEEIHSVVVLLGLSFFGYIWGFTGMFLSVPMLFAIHAWLDVVVRTPTYSVEAREDARFIMGMLEGRWLADSQDSGQGLEGVSLLTGQIETKEGTETPPNGRSQSPVRVSGMSAASSQQNAAEGRPGSSADATHNRRPFSQWQVTAECRAAFAVRDPQTEEVLLFGLLLRWIVLAGAYVLVFFGFSIFGWDLSMLIHPSGRPEAEEPDYDHGGKLAAASVTTLAALAGSSSLTTTVAATAASATNAAVNALGGIAGGGPGAGGDGEVEEEEDVVHRDEVEEEEAAAISSLLTGKHPPPGTVVDKSRPPMARARNASNATGHAESPPSPPGAPPEVAAAGDPDLPPETGAKGQRTGRGALISGGVAAAESKNRSSAAGAAKPPGESSAHDILT